MKGQALGAAPDSVKVEHPGEVSSILDPARRIYQPAHQSCGALPSKQVKGISVGFPRLLPGPHLNLGEAYRRLCDLENTRHHLERGLAAAGALGDDGYGKMIRSGLDRLTERLPRPLNEWIPSGYIRS